ncbi:hypothetical protein AADH33_03505 [Psychrobacter sp. KFRI-CH2-11]
MSTPSKASMLSLQAQRDKARCSNEQLRALTHDIVRLFGEWQLNFGNKAKAADYPVQKALLWAKVVLHLQPSAERWQQAKERSILEEWPPSSARDLLALADQDASGYPDMREAYLSAASKRYAHAVVYETARRVGFWDIKSRAEAITYQRWQQIYPKVCSEHANGASFTLPKTQRVTHQHMPMRDDSPFAATVNAFLEGFSRCDMQ